jgi:hypothetical protein
VTPSANPASLRRRSSVERDTMIGAERKVKGVAGAQAERMLIGKAGSGAEMEARNGQNAEAFRAKAPKGREYLDALGCVDLSGAQFDRKSCREFGDDPVADHQLIWRLIIEPLQHQICLWLPRESGDQQRGVEIQRQ